MKVLARFFGRATARPAPRLIELDHIVDQGQSVWAVGDVHGCVHLYRKLEAQILAEARATSRRATIVLLGDVVDRGPATAEMLDLMCARAPADLQRICLRGNHEDMMLQFLDDPDPASDWLHFGGRETLLSYGVDGVDFSAMPKRRLEQFVRSIIPEQHIQFLRRIVPGIAYANYVMVHAGVDPNFAPNNQPFETMMWGGSPDGFGNGGPTVVHGHVIHPAPTVLPHRVAIDTGAYKTGVLTAAELSNGYPPRIITVSD